MALSGKQKRFIEEYLVDLNATQAAIRAGYSPKVAREMGSENLTKPYIRQLIDKEVAERAKRTGTNTDRIVRELAKIAFVNPVDVININDATIKTNANTDDTAAIASIKSKVIPTENGDIVEREIKMADKLKALELLGKHIGMFANDSKIKDAIPVKIVDDI